MITKRTPFLIIGFGSIGQRHFNNLRSLGYSEVFAYDVDKKKTESLGDKAIHSISPKTLSGFLVVLVCNPSQMHVKTAFRALEAGCHVFVEKPVALPEDNLEKLVLTAKKRNRVLMGACHYRFHPGFIFLEKFLKEERLGRVLSAFAAIGYDVRTARPGVDYRKTYIASRRQGGGVLIDSGAHVVDYLVALFGDVAAARVKTKKRLLKMKAEDYAILELDFKNEVAALTALDYFSIPRKNFLEVQCEKGKIRWDLPSASVVVEYEHKQQKKLFFKGLSQSEAVNLPYVAELRHFIDAVNKNSHPISGVNHIVAVQDVFKLIKKTI